MRYSVEQSAGYCILMVERSGRGGDRGIVVAGVAVVVAGVAVVVLVELSIVFAVATVAGGCAEGVVRVN